MRRAIPRGSVRAAHPTQSLRALEADYRFARFYANRQASLRAVLEALIASTDLDTMTARPGHAYLERVSGVKGRSLRRQLHTLRKLGVVGLVSPGRLAEHTAPSEDGRAINEASVYVLTCPADFARAEFDAGVDPNGWRASQPFDSRVVMAERRQTVDKGVGEFGLPSPRSGGPTDPVKEPSHARNEKRGEKSSSDDGVDPPRLRRAVEFWPMRAPTRTKAERIRAGEQLRMVAPVLRVLSGRDVASICRPFLKNSWSVFDLAYAIDHAPGGRHDMLPIALGEPPARVRGWLRHRLEFWRAGGAIVPSKSEQDRIEAEAIRRRHVEAWDALQAERAERARLAASPGRARAVAEAKAAAAAGTVRAAELVGRPLGKKGMTV